jgi:hypothetical protein
MRENRSEPDRRPRRDGKNGGVEIKKAEKREKQEISRKRGNETPLREACLSEKKESDDRRDEVVAKPSERAKRSGTPNNRMVTWLAVGARVLRASRSGKSRR